jgi:hypothetical protein
MRWPARIVAGGRRLSAERAYDHARALAAKAHTPQPASWWGLCAMLSSYQLHHATLRPMAELWAELLPFLHIPDDALAIQAVEEYLVYLEDPVLADKQWLGIQIDDALTRVDQYDESIGELLENPVQVFEAKWMALLSYQTLLRVRRAVALYSVRPPHSTGATYWHGVPLGLEHRHPAHAVVLT